MAPYSIFEAKNVTSFFSDVFLPLVPSICIFDLLASHLRPCDYTGYIWIIQDNLKIPNIVTSAKSFFAMQSNVCAGSGD